MENRKKVSRQADMDMVPQKNNDTVHDFENDPIETYIDGSRCGIVRTVEDGTPRIAYERL